MPAFFLRRLTGRNRTRRANRQLGAFLAFVAGAVNAGGFLAIKQYTSHMTGIVSSVADNLVLGNLLFVFSGLGALISFLLGAATTAILINWARHRKMHSEYALSLALEAVLLLVFGFLGANLNAFMVVFFPATVIVLCYIMGLQNAIVTKISHAEIRTTHVTGLVTDIGIELGKLFYWNRNHKKGSEEFVVADREKLGIHAVFLLMFFVGGVMGALGFKSFGFIAILPIACALMFMAFLPILDDIRLHSSVHHDKGHD
jgi:uncharacterized membrane protein YoaK (UPF0700 family)